MAPLASVRTNSATPPAVRLAAPNLRGAAEDLGRVLASGHLGEGHLVSRLEFEVRELLGKGDVVAVSSGTAALYLSLLLRGVGAGDSVVVPAFSFVATANVVEMLGAQVKFVDVQENIPVVGESTLSMECIRNAKAFMPVHEFGIPVRTEWLANIQSQTATTVIEDAACAMGSTLGKSPLGVGSDLGCFSLHPRKLVTSAEGGLIWTADAEEIDMLRRLRSHGILRGVGGIDLLRPSLNFRMTDIHAAIGLTSLANLERAVTRRREIALRFLAEIRKTSWTLPEIPAGVAWNVQTFQVVLPEGADRTRIVKHLADRGIESGPAAQFIPGLTYYKSTYPTLDLEEFPNARRFADRGLALPAHEEMSDQDVDRVLCAIDELDI